MTEEFKEILKDYQQWQIDNDYELTEAQIREDLTESIASGEFHLTDAEQQKIVDSLDDMVTEYELQLEEQRHQQEYDRFLGSLSHMKNRADAQYLLYN